MMICTHSQFAHLAMGSFARFARGAALALVAFAVMVAISMPGAASAMTRLQRNLLVLPQDFLANEEPPDCARSMWNGSEGDPRLIAAIDQDDLEICQRQANSANRLRRNRESAIVAYRKTIIRQRERISSDPVYPEQAEEMDVVAKLLEQSACNGAVWSSYDNYMDDLTVEYRLLARIVSARLERQVNGDLVPLCRQ